MAPRNLLVVLLDGGSRAELRRAIAWRGNGSPAVRVVAPTRVGKLQWLVTDEDEARAEAETHTLWRRSGCTWTRPRWRAKAGDVDPVQAVEDELRAFPAEEVLRSAAPMKATGSGQHCESSACP